MTCKTSRWQYLKTFLQNLDYEEFMEKTQETDPELVLLDVRTLAEYDEYHLPGALLIDYLSKDLWDQLDRLDRDKIYLVYCRSGRRSLRVCTLMRNGGFYNSRIFNLSEGLVSFVDKREQF